MARLLSDYGIVKNESKCLCELKKYISDLAKVSDDNVIKRVNASVSSTNKCRYFDFNYLELNENEHGKEVMWVDSGFKNSDEEEIYIQFTGGNPWTGALVGTEKSIIDYQNNYRKSKKEGLTKESLEKDLGVDLSKINGVNVILASDEQESQSCVKVNKNESFLNAMLSKLLVPDDWSLSSLDNYLNLCISRINSLIVNCKDFSSYVVFNQNKSAALINSGLLDKFGKYIMILTRIYNEIEREGKPLELGYTGLRFGGSKISLCEEGFKKEDLSKNIERVSFTDNGLTDLVFSADLDDFDLESRSRLEHCITERRFRFPESNASDTEEMICADIIKAIELAVELNKYDRNYIKPIYNRNRDSIDFVIPYHVGNDFKKKPELGIVIAYFHGYWQIMTVLDYDDVLRDIKLFNMYENETF